MQSKADSVRVENQRTMKEGIYGFAYSNSSPPEAPNVLPTVSPYRQLREDSKTQGVGGSKTSENIE